jgi:hypothetical protein
MHLSAHRAIGVRDVLVKDGVGADRFMIAGYGEFRPVTANGNNGAAANRRVEIYLTRYFIPRGGQSAPASAPAELTIVPAAPAPAAAASIDNEPTK